MTKYGVTRRVIELTDTTSADVGEVGAAYSGNTLMPAIWLRSIVDAAKKRWFATQYAYETEVSKGNKDVIVPLRTAYIGSGSTGTFYGQALEGADIQYTRLDNLCGVVLTPADKNAGIAITNKIFRTLALDVIAQKREDLMYYAGDFVDRDMFNTLKAATLATAAARGAQRVLGGDAASASELGAGDTITTDMIVKGKRLLKSSICKYWTAGAEATSTAKKNPWDPSETGAPFVALIASEQEETLATDSQFTNAAEYGSDAVVGKGFGEVGMYQGVRIVVSENVPSYAAADTHQDGTAAAVAQHRCLMIKAQKAAAIAWGQKSRLAITDYPWQLEKRLILEQAFQTKMLYDDAVVFMDVADQ